jgi:hypothetical protein
VSSALPPNAAAKVAPRLGQDVFHHLAGNGRQFIAGA